MAEIETTITTKTTRLSETSDRRDVTQAVVVGGVEYVRTGVGWVYLGAVNTDGMDECRKKHFWSPGEVGCGVRCGGCLADAFRLTTDKYGEDVQAECVNCGFKASYCGG